MKRKLLIFFAFAIMLFAITGCNKDTKKDKVLHLYTWEGMFPDEILKGFEEKHGISVSYSNFILDEDMLAKLQQTKGGDYDLVIADDYIIEVAIAEGLVAKLEKSKLENYKNINPVFQGQFFDPKDEYVIPHGSGIPLIVYNEEAVDVTIEGYTDLWDSSLKDEIVLIGNQRVINGIVLKTLGYSFNTEKTEELEQMRNKLLELAPNVRLVDDSTPHSALISGDANVAFMYTSQVYEALAANPKLKTVMPKEGAGFGIMGAFIPSKAPNSEAAYLFLDYILEEKNAAKCFEFLGYYCTNKAGEKHISEDMKPLIVLPDDDKDLEMIENISAEAENYHNDTWIMFEGALK